MKTVREWYHGFIIPERWVIVKASRNLTISRDLICHTLRCALAAARCFFVCIKKRKRERKRRENGKKKRKRDDNAGDPTGKISDTEKFRFDFCDGHAVA